MNETEIKNHKIAAEKLGLVKNKAFEFIKKNIGKISEYDVSKFILSEFKRQNLIADKNYSAQIVAVNQNAAFVHYFPSKNKSQKIVKNCLVLIDIWARLKQDGAPFADITWMGYSGKKVPSEIKNIFDRVVGARDFAVSFIKKNLREKRLPGTKAIDGAVRDYFKKFNCEKYFIHGTGHSLGRKECHGKYFRFGKKSKAKLKPNIPFTIEPGLYFRDRFGARSEINCYVTADYKLEITTEIQKKLIKI